MNCSTETVEGDALKALWFTQQGFYRMCCRCCWLATLFPFCTLTHISWGSFHTTAHGFIWSFWLLSFTSLSVLHTFTWNITADSSAQPLPWAVRSWKMCFENFYHDAHSKETKAWGLLSWSMVTQRLSESDPECRRTGAKVLTRYKNHKEELNSEY